MKLSSNTACLTSPLLSVYMYTCLTSVQSFITFASPPVCLYVCLYAYIVVYITVFWVIFCKNELLYYPIECLLTYLLTYLCILVLLHLYALLYSPCMSVCLFSGLRVCLFSVCLYVCRGGVHIVLFLACTILCVSKNLQSKSKPLL